MNLLKKLEQTKVRTSDYFELSEDELSRTYASGKWNIRFILHHLADTETILFDRIRRIISKPRQVIWDFDQDAWANSLNYEKRPLQLSSKLFTSTRAGIIYYAGLHYEKDGDLEFVHSRTGTRTLRQEFEKVA
ncbi:MAG: DinB family protein, partial [Balneolaceae bacterium]